MLNSAERNDYQNESIGPKPKKSLKSRRNQKLIKAVGSFAPQEFGEIVKQENMKDYNPIVLDSLSEVNKGVLENPCRFSNHDRDDSDHSSKMNSKSEGKNNSFTAEQTNNFEDVADLPPLLNDPIEALENYSNPDGLNESKVSTVLNIKINDQDEDQKSDSNPIQPLGKPKCKKKHKECKHKNKDGHKHHKHQSNHKNKSSDKCSTIKKSETSSSHSRTPVLQARKVENKSSPSKSSTPKMNTRRDLMAENLKNKAEELVMKRINKEKRKNTEDVNLEKLNLDQSNNNDESDCTTLNNIISSEKKVNKVKRPHKESVAKPLYEDSDDESPSSKKFCSGKVYLDGKFNDAMSKLIDDKRSTIKEQIEDEENFTGSSLNVSENLHLIGISKFILNKSDSKPEKPTFNQQDEEKPAKSLRKFSNHLYDNDKRESMKIQEKKIRKFTENVDDSSFFKMSKKLTDHETTTQEGTCAVSPFNKKSRRESGFEGYAASTSIISTPIMMSKQLKHNSDLSAYADRKNTIVSQISILKSLAGTNIERIEEEKHQNDD